MENRKLKNREAGVMHESSMPCHCRNHPELELGKRRRRMVNSGCQSSGMKGSDPGGLQRPAIRWSRKVTGK